MLSAGKAGSQYCQARLWARCPRAGNHTDRRISRKYRPVTRNRRRPGATRLFATFQWDPLSDTAPIIRAMQSSPATVLPLPGVSWKVWRALGGTGESGCRIVCSCVSACAACDRLAKVDAVNQFRASACCRRHPRTDRIDANFLQAIVKRNRRHRRERRERRRFLDARRAEQHADGKAAHAHGAARARLDHPFARILQLPDVTRPAVAFERVTHRRRDLRHFDPTLAGDPP